MVSITSSLSGQLLSVLPLYYQIHIYIFVEKMREASHIFSIKNMCVFKILKFEILTKRELTTSLVLNIRGPALLRPFQFL